MAKLDDLVARLRLDSTDFNKGMRGVEATMGRVQRQATSTGAVFKGVFGGVVAARAVEGLFAVIRGGITELMEAEAAAGQTAAVIRSTGGVALVTASKVNALASEIQGLTGVEDDQILTAQNLLLTFDKISGADGTFERATRAAIDLSVAFGQDAKSSAIQLGKALQDPLKGITALNRVGVQFDAQQRKQIEAMVKAGDTAGAQRIILENLERQVGGAAEAYGQTLPGKVDRGRRAIEDFQEQLVAKVVPFIAETVIPTLDRMWDSLNGEGRGRGSGGKSGWQQFVDGLKAAKEHLTALDETGAGDKPITAANKKLQYLVDLVRGKAPTTPASIAAAGAAAPSENIAKRLDDLLKSGTKAVTVNRRVAESVADVTTATEDQAEAAKSLTRAQNDLAAAHRRVDDAVFDLADAEDDLREAQHRQGVGSEEAIKAGRNVERARLRIADAQAAVAADVVAVSEANKAAAEAISSGLTKIASAVDNLAKAAGVPGSATAGARADTGNVLGGVTQHNTYINYEAAHIAEQMNRDLDWASRARAGRGGRAKV